MKTVVTGGAGFIGSHLAKALVDRGYEVLVIDDLSTGKPGNIPPEAEIMQGTVFNTSDLIVAFNKADIVFHLAAVASVPESIYNPVKTFNTNVVGTVNVLEAAKQTGVKKVIFASSCAVYGDADNHVQTETDQPNPISPYALGKLVAEWYCNMYSKMYSLPTVCLRYFNVFGRRQARSSSYGLAVPTFIDCAADGCSLPVYGGSQTRDYVFVDDVVEANILSMADKMTGVYNVGSGKSTSIIDLAKLIIEISNSKSVIEYLKPREGDPNHACADISKIVKEGFTPKWTLRGGLEEMVHRSNK